MIVQICFREINTLTALTVIINNIYNVEFLEYDVSKVNPTRIIINQLSIIEFLFINELYIQYIIRICAHTYV